MPAVFDLEKAVKEWAMKEFESTATFRQKRLLKKQRKKNKQYIGIQVDWSGVEFQDNTQWRKVRPEKFDATQIGDQAAGGATAESKQSAPAQPQGDTSRAAGSSLSHASVLFQTRFINNTDGDQEYTIKTEKSTRSTCTAELEHSFTKGMEMSVTLKSPGELLEANAGFHAEETLTNNTGQEFEEEMMWGVESLVKVRKQHVAEAQLVVEEKKHSGEFTVTTTARGMIYVTFTNLKDNNSFLKATGHDLCEIVSEYVRREGRKGQTYEFVTTEGGLVTIRTKGNCNFRYGVKQEIKVNQVPLS